MSIPSTRKKPEHTGPPVFIHAVNAKLVLEIKVDEGKVIVAQKKDGNVNQHWIIEDNGIIRSCANHDLVLDYPKNANGSIVAAKEKDEIHNWHQLWELYQGFIRSRANHNLNFTTDSKEGSPVNVQKLSRNREKQQWEFLLVSNGNLLALPTEPSPRTKNFDPTQVRERLKKLWSLPAHFGVQSTPENIFNYEIVSDRYCLIDGFQLLRDELQLAFKTDLSRPTVVSTLAHTACGDRINHHFHTSYSNCVASRFANLSISGGLMPEYFSPAGGGTDDGGVLAHVTVDHQLDVPIRDLLYAGNVSSYALVNFDLTTHVGVDFPKEEPMIYGKARESAFREPRNACGAVIGALSDDYDESNIVHRRIKETLGDNYTFLKETGVKLPNGISITNVVAAAIIAIQGLYDTCDALTQELDARSVAHATATIVLNGADVTPYPTSHIGGTGLRGTDALIYLARATMFGGVRATQGFGADATKYSGKLDTVDNKIYLTLMYDNHSGSQFPIETTAYTPKIN